MKIFLMALVSTLTANAQNHIRPLPNQTEVIKNHYSRVTMRVVCVGQTKILVTNGYAPGSYQNSVHSLILSENSEDCSNK